MRRRFKAILSFIILFSLVLTFNFKQDTKVLAQEEKDKKFVVCIDPGHQEKGDSKGESIGPGASQKKPRVSSGTAGVGTKKAEYMVNLEASLILKDILQQNGYEVVMTRETNDVNISNAERAEVSNKAEADMTIRIHCDSLNDSGKTGASILVPSKSNKYTGNIYKKSNDYGNILKASLEDEGIKVNGVFERNDITGFNWSQVPVVILEMGFMSNWNEDRMLCDINYQRKLMECVKVSLDEYKENNKN
ncbi:N-acetylmuramoyl-L-alanine amidase [Clostridium senegalense]|uniref:N-acetylmuramoyl-L-alanine amidase n=1 Tax=Clostridium senegalense TaxID=1465809 RepID=UPI001C11698D|nr:N-acetylmuramoyl-L-alanine amidase [Clostridium senegalense]MBU5227912.1 N-acetylmuramoyl-L-alanine amidase [Clostridium senegalense]